VPTLSTNFEILSRVHGNSELQKKVFKSAIIIINYCIIINHTYYNCIINAQCNYYIFNKGLLEACNREENVKAAAAPTTSCLKRRL
jgi:hypothetical protein